MDWLAGSITSTDERVVKIAREYAQAKKEYLEKFGEDSLERVSDIPHPITSSVSSYLKSIEKLRERVQNNKPFDQIPEEMWKNLIF